MSSTRKSFSTKLVATGIIALIIGIAGGYGMYPMLNPSAPTAPTTATATAAAVKQVLVGNLLPLSGDLARYGELCREGSQMAVDEINAAGGISSLGGANIVMVWGDIKSSTTVTESETERIISTYHPAILTGSWSSSLTYIATEVAERNKVPFYVPVALSEKITSRGFNYTFRTAPLGKDFAVSGIRFALEAAKQKGISVQTMGLIYEDSLLGQTTSAYARQFANDNGLQIVVDQAYPASTADLSPIVIKLKAANPDIVVMASYLQDSILMARTFHELGFTAKAFVGTSGSGYVAPDFIQSAGKDAEYFTNTVGYSYDMKGAFNQAFVTKYNDTYGVIPDETAGMCYTGMNILKQVFEIDGKLHPSNPLDPDSIRDAWLKIDISSTDYPFLSMLPSGRVKIDPATGDNVYRAALVVQVISGIPHTVWPFEVASTPYVFPVPPWSQRS